MPTIMQSRMQPAIVLEDQGGDESQLRDFWLSRYKSVRQQTLSLTNPLSEEDQQVQSMPDASPTKWHLAHTSWFFDVMILRRYSGSIGSDHSHFLFNSYYEALGARQSRASRGLITRPTLHEVRKYRDAVDQAMTEFILQADTPTWIELARFLELGLQHEQQHQELILMDIKHLFSCNPSLPAFTSTTPIRDDIEAGPVSQKEMEEIAEWVDLPAELLTIGAAPAGFAFDNERPRHKVWCEPGRLRLGLVSCGEWLNFIEDGGYQRPELWLAEGWESVTTEGWGAPLYWRRLASDEWWIFTLYGEKKLQKSEPVCHVSYFEADAFARWAGCRLPTEFEWERAAQRERACHAFNFHPASADPFKPQYGSFFGAVWQWTSSAYGAYPGFRPEPGAAGEYNGKFMSGQMILRGGACITPVDHVRVTYRNFYPPTARWAFSGVRLAHDG